MAKRPTRQYSRDYPKPARGGRHRIEIDQIPPALYHAVKGKAKREGISLRALVLAYLDMWARTEGATPDPLDRPCPVCKVPPGMPCRINTLHMTPRTVEKTVAGVFHKKRVQ